MVWPYQSASLCHSNKLLYPSADPPWQHSIPLVQQQFQNGFQLQGFLLSSSKWSRNILLAEGPRAQDNTFRRNNQKKTIKSTLTGAEDSFLGSSSGLEQSALEVTSITIAFKRKFNTGLLKLTSPKQSARKLSLQKRLKK